MASKVILKSNTVTSSPPTVSDIDPGEFAVNLPDGILYGANSTIVFEVGANNTQISVGANNVFANSTSAHVTTDLVTDADIKVGVDLKDGSDRVLKVYDDVGTLIWG